MVALIPQVNVNVLLHSSIEEDLITLIGLNWCCRCKKEKNFGGWWGGSTHEHA